MVVEYATKAGTGAVAFMAKDKLAICQGPPAEAAAAVKQDTGSAQDETGEEVKPKKKSKAKEKSKATPSGKTSGSGKNGKTGAPAQQ